jgi:hypothetical protein
VPYKPVAELRGKRYVTVAQASAMTGGLMSPGTIRDLIVRGQIPGSVRAGRRYYLPRQAVDDLVVDVASGGPIAPPSPPAPQRVIRPPASTYDAVLRV